MKKVSFTAPHFGITVPDLNAAIRQYEGTLGLRLLAGPLTIREEDVPLGPLVKMIYGSGFRSFDFAHLATSHDIGIELFHFSNTPTDVTPETPEYSKKGFNHIGLTCPFIEQAVKQLVEAGGSSKTGILLINTDKNYKIAYCSDPWGNTIELCSHPYFEMWEGVTGLVDI